jgi:hypothetical protein
MDVAQWRSYGRRMAKALRGSSPSLRRFRVAVAGRRVRDQGLEQMFRGMSDVVHSTIESFFVRFRGFRKTTQLADELKRRSTNLVLGRRRQEVMKGLNVSAHGESVNFEFEQKRNFQHQARSMRRNLPSQASHSSTTLPSTSYSTFLQSGACNLIVFSKAP